LVVITIVAIIAGVVVTQFDSTSYDRLLGTAQIVATDISRARNYAVTNNSSYKIAFQRDSNSYTLTHSGSNSTLDELPESAFHFSSGTTTQQTTDLSSLPMGSGVSLAAIEASDPILTSMPEAVLSIEFGPLGETSRPLQTTIWLSTGADRDQRFISIEINPITGLTEIGTVQTITPYTLEQEILASQMQFMVSGP
jgi:Tfp pilus assembly protein FimT